MIRTDGCRSYSRLQKLGCRHDKAVMGGDPELVERVLPRVHRVAALLKRWLLGTHQGAMEHQQLECSEACQSNIPLGKVLWSQIPSLLSQIAAATRLTGLQHTSTLPAEARPGRQALLVERGAAMQDRSKEGETK